MLKTDCQNVVKITKGKERFIVICKNDGLLKSGCAGMADIKSAHNDTQRGPEVDALSFDDLKIYGKSVSSADDGTILILA